MERTMGNIIGWTLILCGVAYAVFGTWHCDAARFVASCVAVLGGVTAMDGKDESKGHTNN